MADGERRIPTRLRRYTPEEMEAAEAAAREAARRSIAEHEDWRRLCESLQRIGTAEELEPHPHVGPPMIGESEALCERMTMEAE